MCLLERLTQLGPVASGEHVQAYLPANMGRGLERVTQGEAILSAINSEGRGVTVISRDRFSNIILYNFLLILHSLTYVCTGLSFKQ